MKVTLRCITLLFLLSPFMAAQAEVICMKDNQSFTVSGKSKKRVSVRTPSLFTTAPARCPLGYTLLVDVPSGELTADSYSGGWSLAGAPGQASAVATISFPKALAAAPTQVVFVAAGQTDSMCTGTAENPTAPLGILCFYESFTSNMSSSISTRYVTFNPSRAGDAGASKLGTAVYGYPASAGLSYYAWGTWAVSQP
jgi:hypothetical protein